MSVAEKLDDVIIQELAKYGFNKDYVEENNSEFRIEIYPTEEIGFGTEEHFAAWEYNIFHQDKKLFSVDILVKNTYSDGEHRLEVQFETRAI